MRVRVSSLSSMLFLLAGFAGYAPGALAQNACSCMCTDAGTAQWMCSTPFSTQAPESCAATQCPVAGSGTDETPTDTPPVTDPTDEVTDPVADGTDVVEPPAAGLECKRRNVYRPDLGKYKTYKVCKPAMSEEEKARIAEYRARMQERWAAHQAKHQHSSHKSYRGRHGRGGHGD
ncbi:MAG: hypothetical protein KDI31_11980 [Pseudomonadales bacterium]|nr:hypothetical protein [Pseudomonadales bacterium]